MSIIAETKGEFFIVGSSGSARSRGVVTMQIVKDKTETMINIISKGVLMISQEINAALDFHTKVNNDQDHILEWLLLTEDGTVRLLKLVYRDNSDDVKLAISIALFEASAGKSFESAVDDDDKEWAQDAVLGTTTTNDDEYTPEFDYQEGKRGYTMCDDEEPPRERRIAHLKATQAQKDKSDSDNDDDEDDWKPKSTIRSSTYSTPAKGKSGMSSTAPSASSGRTPSGIQTSMRKGKVTNSLLESGTTLNRTYVARGGQLGVFGYTEDDELDYISSLNDIKTTDGQSITPGTMQLHDADTRMLFIDENDTSKVYNMDLERGVIVDVLEGMKGMSLQDIAPRSKYAQTTNEQTIVAVGNNAVFTLDPRINKKDKTGDNFEYKTPVNFSAVATSGSGYVATASKKGDIRLYSKIQKSYCKTLLPGLGNEVTHVDITEDGTWMVATTSKYLLVVPLVIEGSKKTGFEARMGKDKPTPLKLTIAPADRVKYKIDDLQFTKAKFNTGTMANQHERWIATSTGNFIITWDFDEIKKGNRNAYKIKATDDNIVRDVFRHNYQNELVVAQQDDVFMNKIKK